VDIDDWAVAYPETEVVRLAGKSIYVLHDLKTLQIDPIALVGVPKVGMFPPLLLCTAVLQNSPNRYKVPTLKTLFKGFIELTQTLNPRWFSPSATQLNQTCHPQADPSKTCRAAKRPLGR
jgi:hypothetical protein